MTPERGKELPTMSKKTKKLALKKESLRNLSEAELGQVNGGTMLYNYAFVDYNWYIAKAPISGTSRTDPPMLYNYYIW
jgi:hypothetical protein